MFHGTFIDYKDFDDITMREHSLTENTSCYVRYRPGNHQVSLHTLP